MFTKFGSIKNSYDTGCVRKIISKMPLNTKFVVQEKIHGANFSIGYDINGMWAAKRTSVLSSGESFYNWEASMPNWTKYYNKLNIMLIEQKLACIDSSIIVRGELCGGLYPNMKCSKHIQRGVFYCNETRFIVYDIEVDGEYIAVETAMELAITAGFFVVGILSVHDTIESAMSIDVETLQSVAYKIFGMPELDQPNIAEGIVIKPSNEFRLSNGSRAILKVKSKVFCEKVKTKHKTAKIPKSYIDVSEYINTARYNSAISKIGIDTANIRSVGQEMTQDIIIDYIEDNPLVDKSLLNKSVNNAVYPYVKKQLDK